MPATAAESLDDIRLRTLRDVRALLPQLKRIRKQHENLEFDGPLQEAEDALSQVVNRLPDYIDDPTKKQKARESRDA